MTKTEQALESCEKVLEGVELGNATTSSVLLLCLRIARLLNDTESLKWLQYENSGYPRDKNGKIFNDAWQIGYDNGRGFYNEKKEKVIFTELASQLESSITSQQNAINNFSTEGASVSGDYAFIAMGRLTDTVSLSTKSLLSAISEDQRRLSILKSKYYDYALKKYIELAFSNVTASIFNNYREKVDNYFSRLSSDAILKLQAIEDKINSDNPELYSQALTTCRRLFESVANELFQKYFPNHSEQFYKTKSGKQIDVSGDHYKNKLSAIVETLQDKSVNKTIIGSNIIYWLDWIENLSNLQCVGVHSDITKEDAEQCIIHTYMCLGDVLSLQNEI